MEIKKDIEKPLKEIQIPDRKKRSYAGLYMFLSGIVVTVIVGWLVMRPYADKIWFMIRHPKETEWCMDRYDKILQASQQLFFEQ